MAITPAGGGGSGGYRPLAEINVTPLVDVMLVLLIVFMVAAPLMMAGVPVDLPKTDAKRLGEPQEPLIVSIDRTGAVFVGEDDVPTTELGQRLQALAGEDPERIIYVRGDRSIAYGEVMRLMGTISGAGFAKVLLIAEAAPTAAVQAR
ncbi:MAG TPA: biopolymer transporter ExbD [Geminicoccus sp.]|jgi:biopolymer transport protein ExbD|uniref:ExbD/TolR family protein n=1 Tax=Geminicoccus sp. TaxID=2024832 RepID=UPI002E35CEBF|nr:biopolymer transporter ExbD [Geminicoccus sp.]HEX2524998.1 biopolymer transporter ExbD [Geminicoccus sp.]